MRDIPLALLTATVWTYWIIVGVMVVRMSRKTRRRAGFVPEQPQEQLMWVVWVPLVLLWMGLPWAALRREEDFVLPDFATGAGYSVVRWIATVLAILALAGTMRCWAKMGNRWRMAVAVSETPELITDGPFRRIRHPIYAFSILLVLCSVAILPTLPMLAVAIVNITLLNLKARNEERHLLASLGDSYAAYVAATGRFLPRLRPSGARPGE
jgi:protein-S-isoprenylcysteine O-methyltransferase Ste14